MITFLALAHMLDATQVVWGGGGMITFLALARMLDATQMVWGGGGDDNVPSTCTHVGCYTNGLGWGGDDWMLHKWSGVGGGDNVSRRTLSHPVNKK